MRDVENGWARERMLTGHERPSSGPRRCVVAERLRVVRLQARTAAAPARQEACHLSDEPVGQRGCGAGRRLVDVHPPHVELRHLSAQQAVLSRMPRMSQCKLKSARPLRLAPAASALRTNDASADEFHL